MSRPPNYQRYGDELLGYGELDERKWNRHVAAYYVAHPDEKVPSILEAAERHKREADEDQAAMERGECCGRCSASGICGSQRSGYWHLIYRSRDCPFSDHEIMRQLLPKEDWSIIWEALDRAKDNGDGE